MRHMYGVYSHVVTHRHIGAKMAGVAVACRVAVHVVGLSEFENVSIRGFTVVTCQKYQ